MLTAVVHVLPLERWLYPEIVEIVILVGGWLGYFAWLFAKDRGELRAMGWRREGFGPTAIGALVVFVVGSTIAAGIGAAEGHLSLHWHMLPLALLYPIWGVVQQAIVLGVLARRLDEVMPTRRALVVALTAIAFGMVHAPETILVAGTFVLGLLLTPIYLRWRNLWPLGFVHGWLAIPVYFWIVGHDPWAAVTAG